jgi:hypothetical protein
MNERDRLIAKYGLSRSGHSIFAPSSSSMWLTCAGSLLANAVAVDDAGEDAAYGTVAHTMAERWLNEGRQPRDMLNKSFEVVNGANTFHITADTNMAAFVEQYVDWCQELPGDHYHERRVSLLDYVPIPDQGGTADFFACEMGKLTITDLKMGTGVKVFVERNPQAMLYALGVFLEWDFIYSFERIVIRICQPRLDYFGVWECSRQELLDFGEFVRERSALAWQENAPRTPSTKGCRFCKVKLTCPAMSAWLDDLADDAFEYESAWLDDPADAAFEYESDSLLRPIAASLGISHEELSRDLSNVNYSGKTYDAEAMQQHEPLTLAFGKKPPEVTSIPELTTGFLAYRLRYRKLYNAWFTAIYVELLKRAQRGEVIRGFKIVRGRRAFSWADEAAAKLILEEQGLDESDFAPPKMVTVAEAKKLLRALHLKPKDIEGILPEDTIVAVGGGAPALVLTGDDDRPDEQDAVDDAFTVDDDDL